MYYDILKHKCELERKTLNLALSIVIQAPEEFAFRFMKEPVHMMIAGEVIHLVKCLQVKLKCRDTKESCNQLQVSQGEKKFFL